MTGPSINFFGIWLWWRIKHKMGKEPNTSTHLCNIKKAPSRTFIFYYYFCESCYIGLCVAFNLVIYLDFSYTYKICIAYTIVKRALPFIIIFSQSAQCINFTLYQNMTEKTKCVPNKIILYLFWQFLIGKTTHIHI